MDPRELRNYVDMPHFHPEKNVVNGIDLYKNCLLYTSDASDDMQCVDLGGRRIIKKV